MDVIIYLTSKISCTIFTTERRCTMEKREFIQKFILNCVNSGMDMNSNFQIDFLIERANTAFDKINEVIYPTPK